MSTPCPGNEHVQVIERTECIGNSLTKINSNFKNLDIAACELQQKLDVLNDIPNFTIRDSSTINLTFNAATRVLSADLVGKVSNSNGGAGILTGVLKSVVGTVLTAVPDVDFASVNSVELIKNNIATVASTIVELSTSSFKMLSAEITSRLSQDFALTSSLYSLSSQLYGMDETERIARLNEDDTIKEIVESSIDEVYDKLSKETESRLSADTLEESQRIINDQNLNNRITSLSSTTNREINVLSDVLHTQVASLSSTTGRELNSTYVALTNALNDRVISLSSTTDRQLSVVYATLTSSTASLSSTTGRELNSTYVALTNALNDRVISLSSTTSREIGGFNSRITSLSSTANREISTAVDAIDAVAAAVEVVTTTVTEVSAKVDGKMDQPTLPDPTEHSTLMYNPWTSMWEASSLPPKIIKPLYADAYQVLAYNSSTATWIASSIIFPPEKDDVPLGQVSYFAGVNAPDGWLVCNGAQVSKTVYAALYSVIGNTFGSSATHFNLPDLRGEFIRGWDNGRGTDSGRTFGSFQEDALKSHFHTIRWSDDQAIAPNKAAGADDGEGGVVAGTKGTSAREIDPVITDQSGTTETRPRNVALLPCIKAYSKVINQSSVDVRDLIIQVHNLTNQVATLMLNLSS